MHRLVPDFILRNYAAGHAGGAFPAACMFVDISGFSAMTDALMQHGQHGAEVLAHVMRAAFGPLLRAVYEHRGFVVAQAGDSFTALFPLAEDQTQPIQHALAAAWSIREHAVAHAVHVTPYGEFVVSVKIGMAPGVDSATDAEHHARPGDVIVTEGMVEPLGGTLQAELAGPYYRLLDVADGLASPMPLVLPTLDAGLAARKLTASQLALRVDLQRPLQAGVPLTSVL